MRWEFVRGRAGLLVPGGLAVLAGALAFVFLDREASRAGAGWELEAVVVAERPLAAGERVEAGDLARREVPRRFVSSAVVRPAHLDLVVGQRLEVALEAGEPLAWTHLEGERPHQGLAWAVQSTGRAVTLPVGEAASLGGWLRPNDHVDVIGTFREPTTQELAAVTLLQNVLVLAVGGTGPGRAAPADESAGHVTVLVLPEEAELLALAQEMGGLRLVLRHPDDLEVREGRARTTVQTLLTGERSEELQRRRQRTIQVIRGVPGNSLAGGR